MSGVSRMFLILFVISFLFGCQKDTSPITNVDTPEWLKNYIEDIQDNPNYLGTKIYRYEWKEKFVYHIWIPISSCAYCEIYNQKGEKISFKNDEEFQDFINKKKNEIIIWEWESNP